VQQLESKVEELDLEKLQLLDQSRHQGTKITTLEKDKSQLKDQNKDLTSQWQEEQRRHRDTEAAQIAIGT
jgi:hypothetical protein